MLQDKDRIFTNLYGLYDPLLKGARGAWRLGWHQGDPGKGSRCHHRGSEGIGTARSRRCRVSHRPEMVVHAEAVRSAVLSDRQCR